MRNSSYSFMPIVLKLYRCFGHGLKKCIYFGSNPQNIHLLLPFSQIDFSRFSSRRLLLQRDMNSQIKFCVLRLTYLYKLKDKRSVAGDINSLNLLV